MTKEEAIQIMRSLDDLLVGDLVRNEQYSYRRVLLVLGGEGESKIYVMSRYNGSTTSDELKCVGNCMTVFELKGCNYYHAIPNPTPLGTAVRAIAIGEEVMESDIKK